MNTWSKETSELHSIPLNEIALKLKLSTFKNIKTAEVRSRLAKLPECPHILRDTSVCVVCASHCSLGNLEALPVDDGRAGLIILLLGDPHLLEGGERGQDGATDPHGVLPLRRGDDLDLHCGWAEGWDFLLHTVSYTWGGMWYFSKVRPGRVHKWRHRLRGRGSA